MIKLREIDREEVWEKAEVCAVFCAVLRVDEEAEKNMIHPGVYCVDELTVERLRQLIEDDGEHIDDRFFAAC